MTRRSSMRLLLVLAASAITVILVMWIRRDAADGQPTQVTFGGTSRAPVQVFGVVRRAGSVAAGAHVHASTGLEGVGPQERTARTDSSGTYRMELEQPGTYSFTVNYKGADSGERTTVQIPAVAEFELDLDFVMGFISGRVLGPNGAPVSSMLDIQFDPKLSPRRL